MYACLWPKGELLCDESYEQLQSNFLTLEAYLPARRLLQEHSNRTAAPQLEGSVITLPYNNVLSLYP
jgi:hypothetical protein